MNLSGKRPQVIATIALCALVTALGVGAIAQQLAASRLSAGVEAQKQLLSKSRKDLKDRAKYRAQYGDLSLKLGGRMSTCSWSDQMPYMVAQVSGIVESNGLKIASIQPEPMTSSGSIQRFPMRISFQTDLKHVTEVLKDLKTSQPLVDVERLDVRTAQGANATGSGKLQVNMTVASFVVLDKNSPVVRRRAVIPVKTKEKKPAEAKGEKAERPAAKPEAKEAEKPAPKPTAKPRPAGPNGAEHKRPEAAPPPHTEKPANGNGGKPAGTEVEINGKKITIPAGADPNMIKAIQEKARGGAR